MQYFKEVFLLYPNQLEKPEIVTEPTMSGFAHLVSTLHHFVPAYGMLYSMVLGGGCILKFAVTTTGLNHHLAF